MKKSRPNLVDWVTWVDRAGGRWATHQELAGISVETDVAVKSHDNEAKYDMGPNGPNRLGEGGRSW